MPTDKTEGKQSLDVVGYCNIADTSTCRYIHAVPADHKTAKLIVVLIPCCNLGITAIFTHPHGIISLYVYTIDASMKTGCGDGYMHVMDPVLVAGHEYGKVFRPVITCKVSVF